MDTFIRLIITRQDGTEQYCMAHAARFDEAAASLLASEKTAAEASEKDTKLEDDGQVRF